MLKDGQRRDVVVRTDEPSANVELVAARLAEPDDARESNRLGLVINPGRTGERVLRPDEPLSESGLRSGDVVALVPFGDGGGREREKVATLHVVGGEDATPQSYPLMRGTNTIGRAVECDVRLTDPMISKRHARVIVGGSIEIVDDQSANGIQVGGTTVDRAILRPGDRFALGEADFSISLDVTSPSAASSTETFVPFNRSPRLDPYYDGVDISAPPPPEIVGSQRFPIITLVVPLLLAGVLFAVTRNALSVLFLALSPLMLVGSYAERKYALRRELRESGERYDRELAEFRTQLATAAHDERVARSHEHPSVEEVADAVKHRSPLLWTRRPRDRSFLSLRIGLGSAPSRTRIAVAPADRSVLELRRRLQTLVDEFRTIGPVPIVVDLREVGSLGVASADALAGGHVNGLLAQVVGLHAPGDLVVAAIAAGRSVELDWLKWIPHVDGQSSPLDCAHVATNATDATRLLEELDDLIQTRHENARQSDDVEQVTPAVVLVVSDDAPIDRPRLVRIIERGRTAGVHVVCLAKRVADLPAACNAYIDVGAASVGVGFLADGSLVESVVPESIDAVEMIGFARGLAPLVDVGAAPADESRLPDAVSLLGLGGVGMAEDSAAISENWRQNRSLPGHQDRSPSDVDNSLRALVGQGAGGPLHLDLRAHGPHALVGGTTGSGKSEFLQTWVLALAAMHSPRRVTFLFVDYKGGAAFGDCVDLPHSVGLVTDLSPHLVRRALVSLEAEVRHREQILNDKKAKDLIELERRGDPDAPPSLVIVVDEFAALASDVPDFVDGVVNIAQRGRSLGLHLILATQRPAGVIKDNLRANTNLRVALRVADEADSVDVIGIPTAAGFDSALPGRAIAKLGPGRLTAFQAAYVGGRTPAVPDAPEITIADLVVGPGRVWDNPSQRHATPVSDAGPSDLRRIVDTVSRAARENQIELPRRPWLPELADSYELAALVDGSDGTSLQFGIADEPDRQRQTTVSFDPDADGNIAVFGTGGAGKSTFLRTLAVAASMGSTPDDGWQIQALDFGARGLQMLESLPSVGSVISGDDAERVARLLRSLKATIDDRAQRFASLNAGTLSEYRAAGGVADSRILLLVDGLAAFRQTYEGTLLNRWWDLFQSVMTDGRSVGIHVAVSADRAASVPSSIAALIQRRVVLRLASDNEYMMVGVAPDVLGADSPVGRGVVDGREMHVAVLGGEPGMAVQSGKVDELALRLTRAGVGPTPPIERLPSEIDATMLPATVDGRPVIGVWDETLKPIGLPQSATFLVSGPPGSGRTTALETIARAVRGDRPDARLVLLAQPGSVLLDALDWDRRAVGPTEIAASAEWLIDEIVADDTPWFLFVEGIGDLLNTEADMPLQALLKHCRSNRHHVVAEGETTTLAGSWPLLQMAKFSRCGLALQPDAVDGDSLFKTSFPRLARADFPPGRGLLVRSGEALRIQVAQHLRPHAEATTG